MLTQHYEPEPGFITADVAREVAAFADVTVVTAHPNYPYGRFYAGSRWWRPTRSVEDGVVVVRVPFFATRSTAVFVRGLSYLSYAVTAALAALFVMPRPDVIWAYHGPFTTAVAGLVPRLLFGARLVITGADLWPESLGATSVLRAGVLMRALYAYSRWINRRADLIVCATRGTLDRYHRDGEPEDKLRFVPVWIRGIPESLGPVDGADEKQTIVYAGNLGPAQCLQTVITAAAMLRESRPKLRFELYGSGVSERELRLQADAEGATNLVFKGRIPPERAFAVSAAALAQIVSLAPTPLFRATIPSKLAFALAAGSPLLSGLEGEAAAIAADSGAAFSYIADSPESLVKAIHALLDSPPANLKEMRENARRYYLAQFERRRLMAHYGELLLDLSRRNL